MNLLWIEKFLPCGQFNIYLKLFWPQLNFLPEERKLMLMELESAEEEGKQLLF